MQDLKGYWLKEPPDRLYAGSCRYRQMLPKCCILLLFSQGVLNVTCHDLENPPPIPSRSHCISVHWEDTVRSPDFKAFEASDALAPAGRGLIPQRCPTACGPSDSSPATDRLTALALYLP